MFKRKVPDANLSDDPGSEAETTSSPPNPPRGGDSSVAVIADSDSMPFIFCDDDDKFAKKQITYSIKKNKRSPKQSFFDGEDLSDSPIKREHQETNKAASGAVTYTHDKKRKQHGQQHLASVLEMAGDSLDTKFRRTDSDKQTDTWKMKTSKDNANYSGFGEKMMKKMGHVEGQGIGKLKQGIVKPIDESEQKGKHGLGFASSARTISKVDYWNFDNDRISHIETPVWLVNDEIENEPFSLEQLLGWKQIGQKKVILDDEDKFCSRETLKQVLSCKSIFDDIDNRDMMNARFRSNPFEAINARFFQNRAAMKMANIDAVFNFMFTNPKYEDGRSKVELDEPVFFCDVCAGPGGFSEYVLWRKKWNAKGFGMTLKNDNDFRLDDFLAGSAEYFEPYYGEHGVDGDGDVTKKTNLQEFERFVLEQTSQRGVHFFMADGGFSVEGNENIQEILSKQLYLCQFLCGISVLREGGNFVCKLFDLFTPFSVALIYLMYRCFERVCIHKPVTSRPANSERYLVCESMRSSNAKVVYSYLHSVNDSLNETFANRESSKDVTSLVPMSILKGDSNFFNYVFNSNETLGKIQVFNLKKIQAFSTNRNLFDTRQSMMIEECLKYWHIPDQLRVQYAGDKSQEHENGVQKYMGGKGNKRFKKEKFTFAPLNHTNLITKLNEKFIYSLNHDLNAISSSKLEQLNSRNFQEMFKKCSVHDFKCVLSCGTLVLLLACGRSHIYELELNSPINSFAQNDTSKYSNAAVWKSAADFKIELPKESLILAEKVTEYSEQNHRSSTSIHIIDAFFLDGENLVLNGDKVTSYTDRHEKIKVFLKAVTKKSRHDLNTVRLKDVLNFDPNTLEVSIFDNLVYKPNKNVSRTHAIHLPLCMPSDHYVYPSGIYLFKYVQSPWSIVVSKRTSKQYFYNSDSRISTYEVPDTKYFFSSPLSYMENCLVWKWNEDIFDETETFPLETISKLKFVELLQDVLK